jgi:hypothetical protein
MEDTIRSAAIVLAVAIVLAAVIVNLPFYMCMGEGSLSI